MNITDLCNAALVYIISINIGNKSGNYTPSGSLANNTTLKTFSRDIVYCPGYSSGNSSTYERITQTVISDESIGSEYLKKATNDKITSDWNAFKNEYILPTLKDKKISLSSIFVFIYLIRCFIDTRFKLFTDIYNKKQVWLYNTNTLEMKNYQVDTSILQTLEKDNLNNIISALAESTINRRPIHILKTKTNTSVSSISAANFIDDGQKG